MCSVIAKDDPLRAGGSRQFNHLMVDDGDRFFFQPCFSPVWDTAIGAYALAQSDPRHAALGARGRLAARTGGPAQGRLVREAPDDRAFRLGVRIPQRVLSRYRRHRHGDAGAQRRRAAPIRRAAGPASKRALDWLLAMQSSDGGWAAFDADNNWDFLSNVPFADHNAMLDPTCPDITGRVLEALAAHGARSQPSGGARAAWSGWCATSEPDGSWYGRWGVAYIYGTCFALRGLAPPARDDREAHVLRAGEWLRSIQNADGGWGESCASYDNGIFTAGPSTPSQTAWAILGLIAGGDANSLSVQHGIEYLLETQRPDGSWDEELATGTGFPKVFYLNYHLYKDYFPLLALSSFVKARANSNG